MKIQIHTDGASIEEAEDFLEKSLKIKKECSHEERYTSEFLNELHQHISDRHLKMLQDIIYQAGLEIQLDANKKRHF